MGFPMVNHCSSEEGGGPGGHSKVNCGGGANLLNRRKVNGQQFQKRKKAYFLTDKGDRLFVSFDIC